MHRRKEAGFGAMRGSVPAREKPPRGAERNRWLCPPIRANQHARAPVVHAFAPEGNADCIVGTNEGHLVEIPIEKALNMTKHLQMERYEVLEAMHNQVPLKCGPIQ